jgi:hypothetical protein
VAGFSEGNVSESGAGQLTPGLLTWGVPRLRDLPWRHTRDPWQVLVAEVMLQRTRAEPNRVAIVMTDGGENASRQRLDSVIDYAIDNGVVLYAIGFGSFRPEQLNRLTGGTGGFYTQTTLRRRETEEEIEEEQKKFENLYNNIFNATQAQGCIDLIFSPTPSSGTHLQGTVTLEFDRSRASSEFDIRF